MNLEFLKGTLPFLIGFIAIAFLFSSRFCDFPFNDLGTEREAVSMGDMTIRLELFTDNIPKTVHFYEDVLGFVSMDSSNSAYRPIMKGQVVLGIGLLKSLGENHYFNPKLSDIQHGYGVEIVLEVNDIELIYKRVVLAGVEIRSELMEQPWGLRDFRVTDPNGYYIRVTSKG